MVAGCKIFKRAEGIPRVEEEGFKSCGTTKGSWMQEEKSNRRAWESNNGCWKQMEVGVKIKIRVGLGFDLVS
ncbi:hypothetical protein A2U01_0078800 [Trifolium medium]|uniref:Uncharacterized protein n=1 Tax=Trifolium medium TaxID=97028 RepID=A0A392T930_9FABA|nr:hypothetical protein [Trifolium medium]